MSDTEPAIEIGRVEDLTALGDLWRDLEARADGSFFQSWAWTGCLAEERFPDPWLLSARRGPKVVALALFNHRPPRPLRRRPTLLLGATGAPAQDSVFIEHNGLLIDRDEPAALAGRCWATLAEGAFGDALWVVNGVPLAVHDALDRQRRVHITARRPAPYADLARIPAGAATILDVMSANARQQLRRSLRGWEKIGPLALDVAATETERDAYCEGLKALHQHYWIGRGRPGAFAEPFFERFHRTLLARAGPGQSIDLIQIRAGARVIGYLYNLMHRGWVAAYQSGIDYGADAERLRPGLICHLLAIDHYRRAGMGVYDFLGGEARYKRSFANADRDLLWLEARPASSWLARARGARPGPR
jgi:CelD/BcsL family acetyltransferase involved in cellulose biosynthesis